MNLAQHLTSTVHGPDQHGFDTRPHAGNNQGSHTLVRNQLKVVNHDAKQPCLRNGLSMGRAWNPTSIVFIRLCCAAIKTET
jgi:hypothetical protein